MNIIKDTAKYIQTGETGEQRLGLEIEHFAVNDDGIQIGFDEISELIADTAAALGADIITIDGHPCGYTTESYSITLEPGCQFEISIFPFRDIGSIKEIYDEFTDLWTPILQSRGYRLETYGLLPLVEKGVLDPDEIPLSPKKRYEYMDAYFENTGKYGKHMMRSSASTQISVDFSSEKDLVRKLRLLQKLSPILMIAMENKSSPDSILKGGEGRPHLLRTQIWDDLDSDRAGLFPGSFDPGFGYDSIARTVCGTPLILLTDGDETSYAGSRTAKDLFNAGVLRIEDIDPPRETKLIEHFLSMVFYHFRIKKFIEIRVADSVPIDRALGYAALIKGIVYSDRAMAMLEEELSDIDSAEKIEKAIEAVEKDGYDAVIYDGKKASEWASHLAETALSELPDTEKQYLENVWTFRSSA